MFGINLWLAKTFGFWKYDGLRGFEPSYWPRARVLYPPEPSIGFPGAHSVSMAIGNAVDYATIFKGNVVPV